VVTHVLGEVGVGGERDRTPRVETHLEEWPGRIQLADRLPHPRRRDLDRDVRLRDALHCAIVEAAQVTVGGPVAPDLHEVGMGEHVEHPCSRRLPEGVEVGRPNLVRIARGPPDVPLAAHVDRIVADEVHGADYVVPVVRIQERRHPVLTARDVVGLDPQPQTAAAHEVDVLVQVVHGPPLPEGVLPDV
jgi:hypothetical protein